MVKAFVIKRLNYNIWGEVLSKKTKNVQRLLAAVGLHGKVLQDSTLNFDEWQ
jgi:hypothetical protein